MPTSIKVIRKIAKSIVIFLRSFNAFSKTPNRSWMSFQNFAKRKTLKSLKTRNAVIDPLDDYSLSIYKIIDFFKYNYLVSLCIEDIYRLN